MHKADAEPHPCSPSESSPIRVSERFSQSQDVMSFDSVVGHTNDKAAAGKIHRLPIGRPITLQPAIEAISTLAKTMTYTVGV